MKKYCTIFAFLMLLTSFTTVFTMENNKKPVLQAYVYNKQGPNLKYYYQYDSVGKIPSYVQYSVIYGRWHVTRIETYSYDSKGNIISHLDEITKDWIPYRERKSYTYNSFNQVLTCLTETGKDSIWLKSVLETFTYDVKGNLLSSIWEKWDDNKVSYGHRSTYSYDPLGNLLSRIDEDLVDGKWILKSKEETSYNSGGKIIDQEIENWGNEQVTAEWHYHYIYDSDNRIIKDLKEFWQPLIYGQKVSTECYIYTFNTEGQILSQLYQASFADTIMYDELKTYVYEDGNLMQELDYFMGDNGYELNNRITNTYNNNKQMITSLEEYENNKGIWSNYSLYVMSYDSIGNLHSKIEKLWQNEKWEDNFWWTFTYDSNGEELTMEVNGWRNEQWLLWGFTYRNYDSCGVLRNYRTTDGGPYVEYSYNSEGELLSFYSGQWGKGKGSFNERYLYSYDTNMNCTKITYEIFYNGNWILADDYLGYTDWRGNKKNFNGYKVDLVYDENTPVKDGINLSDFSLNCSPNPTAGPLNINYTLTEPALTSISISSMLGIEIAIISENLFQLSGNYNLNYNASNLSPGAYFITVKAGNKSETRKIVIND